ncbi:thiol-disulfide oxidoreductase DCC family protein [Winogradskyella haliclonae]|uniref:Thiol-disulfide oxidoreductase n=1 Tax=Winogradskyella haliclonae TaxID=2048558 RepID=A0ABQ2BYV0_9FLAO|nr:DCC1-like thiol-disulfide oxidoreductase family protein [Winogradskyella haliclonae]GGI57446.1 thiol-disulfide oxidoreductase [Winogradskyella haliclonae]
MINNIPKDKRLILFDGVCNLCNSSVLYVIKRDKKNKFLFAPLQSKIGETIINEFNIDTTEVDSILLFNPETYKIYSKSAAALHVGKSLNFPTNLMAAFFIIPAFIRNWFYDYIAKNRYKWYGKRDACMIPTPELKAKFLD